MKNLFNTFLFFVLSIPLIIISLIPKACLGQNIFPANGNVGIGTISPIAGLDIFSTQNLTTIPLISLRANFHVSGNYGMIRFGDYTQTTQYQKGAIIYESVAGSARGKFHIALENTDGAGSVTLNDARLTILSDGNVGIGITSPNERLAVNGKIRAKEVKVEVANWPDYVFEEGYQIPSLGDLEKYIKVNGHLPDMPKAKDVESNGIALGEMNKLLLKKIEELSLYLIQKDKEIAELKELKLQVTELQKQLKSFSDNYNKQN